MTYSSTAGRGTVSISNMRNANIFSYNLIILEGINLKRVLDIDDKLFGQFLSVLFDENYNICFL